jgi:hypothetical protein
VPPKTQARKAKINKDTLDFQKGFAQPRKQSTRQKSTYGMGDSICKFHIQQGVNTQNIQETHR